MSQFDNIFPVEISRLTNDLTTICSEIYLVGGAVRNFLLGRKIQDFDFVMQEKSIQAGRFIANELDGDFYVLDHSRKTSRALVMISGQRIKLDFALFNGNDISADLKARDFTVNAMALKLPISNALHDPTNGQYDLKNNILSLCAPNSLMTDPVRVIRAIRFSQEFYLQINEELHEKISLAGPGLKTISPERKRDAFLDVIASADVKAAINQMLNTGIIHEMFPDIEKLKDVDLTPPHTYNSWAHTMQVVHYCQQIMSQFGLAPDVQEIHARVSQAIKRFQPYMQKIYAFFNAQIVLERSQYQLLIISALFHDAAKAVVPPEFSGQRKRFPGHAQIGAEMVESWGRNMGFSNKEIGLMRNAVRRHMRPSKSPFRDPQRKNLAIFRLFHQAADAGIYVSILHLADVLATYESALTDDRWEEALLAVENIFDAYFNHFQEVISPRLYLNGTEILDILQLKQGKHIGKIIDALAEAQAAGNIHSRDEAVLFIKELKAQNCE